MRVQLDAALFAAVHGARFHRELLAIFGWGYEGRHAVEIVPRDAPDFEQWLTTLDANTQDLCRFALDVGLAAEREEFVPRFTLHVAPSHEDAGRWRGGDTLLLPPAAAMNVLGRPLKILLENRQHDGAFLRAVSKVSDRHATRLGMILTSRWAELDSMGGITSNRTWVHEEIKDPTAKARLWVLFDSDALAPGKPHRNARDLAKLCANRGVGHHMLERRACESYVPLGLLQEWRCRGSAEDQRRKRARVQALASLNERQRHYYNMWGGFDGDAEREDIGNVGDLYDDLPLPVRETLRKGIDYAIADLFHEKEISIKARWLIEDAQETEITTLLNDLFSLV